jgi:hypothetical protein
VGNQAILTGDKDGHVVAFSMYSDLWRLRLGDIPHLKVKTFSLLALILSSQMDVKAEDEDYFLIQRI